MPRRGQPVILKQRELDVSLGPILGARLQEHESSKAVGACSGYPAMVRTSELDTGAVTHTGIKRKAWH